MKFTLITTLLLLFTTAAYAQNPRSEFFYQAQPGEHFIQGDLSHESYSSENSGSKAKLNDSNINLTYERGFTEALSAYANTGYGIGELRDTQDYRGLKQLNLGAKVRLAAGSGEFFGKANLGLGIWGDFDCDSSYVCNRTDNSINLVIRLGYLMNFETYLLGFALDYGVFSTDVKVKNGTDVSRKSGGALTAFYERTKADKMFGASLSLIFAGMTGSLNVGPYMQDFKLDVAYEGATFAALTLYTRIPLSDSLDLLGSINYEHGLDFKNKNIDYGKNIGLNAGLRFKL